MSKHRSRCSNSFSPFEYMPILHRRIVAKIVPSTTEGALPHGQVTAPILDSTIALPVSIRSGPLLGVNLSATEGGVRRLVGGVFSPRRTGDRRLGRGRRRCSFNPRVPRASLLIPARTCTIRSSSWGRRLERSVYSAGRCDAERAMNKTPGLLRDFPCRCVHFGAVLFHFRLSRRKRAAP